MSREETIQANINKYLEGMKLNKGHMPNVIHLFEKDYDELLKQENKRRKKHSQEKTDKLPDYRGIPVVKVCKK